MAMSTAMRTSTSAGAMLGSQEKRHTREGVDAEQEQWFADAVDDAGYDGVAVSER